LSHDVIR